MIVAYDHIHIILSECIYNFGICTIVSSGFQREKLSKKCREKYSSRSENLSKVGNGIKNYDDMSSFKKTEKKLFLL